MPLFLLLELGVAVFPLLGQGGGFRLPYGNPLSSQPCSSQVPSGGGRAVFPSIGIIAVDKIQSLGSGPVLICVACTFFFPQRILQKSLHPHTRCSARRCCCWFVCLILSAGILIAILTHSGCSRHLRPAPGVTGLS